METFRCPTCLGVLADARESRSAACGQNLRRRKPRVLGEERRLTTVELPIDRWMLARLHATGGFATSPVAWHGKFATTPLATPDFAATASQVEASLEPTAPAAEAAPTAAEPEVAEPMAPTVAALSLDQYTRPHDREADRDEAERLDEAPAASAAAAEATEVVAAVETQPETSEPAPVAPATPEAPKPAPAEELDPDVRALVDELYRQARAELAGTDVSLGSQAGEPSPGPAVEQPATPGEPEARDARAVAAPPAAREAPPTMTTTSTVGGWVPVTDADQPRYRHLSD